MLDRTLQTVYWAFIAIVVAFGALLVASYVGLFGVSVKIVQSGSMEPAIKTGSIIIAAPVEDYQVGDVITFNFNANDDIPTTHRIVDERVESGQNVYQTKGDANEDVDPREVPERRVLGKVFFSVPFLGYLLDFARKPLGFGLLIGVPAAYIAFEEIMKIVSEVRRARKKETSVTKDESDNQ